MQALLCDTIKFGAIQGTLEKLDTSKGSSKGLAKAVEEVDFTLSGKVRIRFLLIILYLFSFFI